MKNKFTYYIIYWFISLVLFNLIAFLSILWLKFENYTDSFWVGYVFITFTFFGQLGVSYYAFKPTNSKKLFLNLSLFTISHYGLGLMLFFGAFCMALPVLTYYGAIIICAVILTANIIAVLKAKASADFVLETDDKVKQQVSFMKELTNDAAKLVTRAQSESEKVFANKVFDAIKYSDPMSNEGLHGIEAEIKKNFQKFSELLFANDEKSISDSCQELLNVLNDRNRKCEQLK
jgi:hypothetical protein